MTLLIVDHFHSRKAQLGAINILEWTGWQERKFDAWLRQYVAEISGLRYLWSNLAFDANSLAERFNLFSTYKILVTYMLILNSYAKNRLTSGNYELQDWTEITQLLKAIAASSYSE